VDSNSARLFTPTVPENIDRREPLDSTEVGANFGSICRRIGRALSVLINAAAVSRRRYVNAADFKRGIEATSELHSEECQFVPNVMPLMHRPFKDCFRNFRPS
jgi:hypothetical protein